MENSKFAENLNNILWDKLKIADNGSEWSPDKAFRKLHEILINTLYESLPLLDSARTCTQIRG